MGSISIAFLVVLFMGINIANAGVTLEQMQKAAELIRGICQPKFKVSDEQAMQYGQGIFPEDKNSKCYINCVFENTQTMKRGKFNFDAAKKQAEIMLPDDMKVDTLNAMAICKDSAVGIKDPCEASFTLLKCLHGNHENFFFP